MFSLLITNSNFYKAIFVKIQTDSVINDLVVILAYFFTFPFHYTLFTDKQR